MTGPAQSKEDAHGRSELERVLAILRRRAGIIALCVLVVGGAALGASLLQEKEYEATASLLFRDPGFADALFGTNTQVIGANASREAATNEQLVGLDTVAARTAAVLRGQRGDQGLADITEKEVKDMISVSGGGESDIVSVTGSSTIPAQAAVVANAFAREFIEFRAEADRSKLLQAKRLANREFGRLSAEEQREPRGEALSRAAERLGVLASLQTGNAELVQHARVPSSPSSPSVPKNTLLGLFLGLLIGVGLAFVLEQLNRRLRDPDEVREAFELPVLGTIPYSKAIHSANQGLVEGTGELPFGENEAFRMLHASLRYFNVDADVRSVLVTAEAAKAGKSTIAWNLARVAASSLKVALVESDLRKPSLALQHGLRPSPGLAELLTHQLSLDEATQSFAPLAGGNGTGRAHSLDVIVSGAIPPNPAELLASRAMGETLARLKERYDLVVVDTAPLDIVADAFPLLRQVDGVMVVARIGQTTRDGARRMRERLQSLDANVLGVVANAIKVGRNQKYGYGQYGAYGAGPSNGGPPAATRDRMPTLPTH
jgi:capsular exopolysaccharide synthesis family protein